MTRLGRIITTLSAASGDGSLVGGICETAVQLLEADGAGLVLLTNEGHSRVCAAGPLAELGELAQYTLGEGPYHEAMATGLLIESDPRSVDSRWPVFSSEMDMAGLRAIASFPVRIGGARLGALTLYDRTPGPLSSDRVADGYVLAQVAAHVILAAQSDTGSDHLMKELEAEFNRMEPVHQATGIVMGQARVGAEEALSLLRGAAFAANRPIVDLARDVIDGSITFDGTDRGDGSAYHD